MLIELFSLYVLRLSRYIRAKRDRKRGHFDPKFQVEGVVAYQSFLHG